MFRILLTHLIGGPGVCCWSATHKNVERGERRLWRKEGETARLNWGGLMACTCACWIVSWLGNRIMLASTRHPCRCASVSIFRIELFVLPALEQLVCVLFIFFCRRPRGGTVCVCLGRWLCGFGEQVAASSFGKRKGLKKCGCLGSLIVIISVTTGSRAALVWRRQPQRGTEASSRLQSYFRWILMTWLSTRRANWAQDLKAVEIWCIICDGATGFHFDHRWMSTGGPGCGRRLRRGRQPTPVNAIDFSKCAVTNQLMKATRRLEWLWAQSAAAPLGPFFLSLSLSLFHCLYHQRNWSRNMLKTAGRSCRISLMTGRAGVRAENESSVKHCWKCCTDRPCLGFSAVSVIAVWCGCL